MSDIQSATARDLSHARSLLFAPGSDERKLATALASEADLVVADLEDAVAPAEKPAARDVVARVAPRVVRVNGAGHGVVRGRPGARGGAGARRGRAAEGDAGGRRRARPGGAAVIAIVETAQGLRLAYETACSPRVAALILGAVDLGAELGLEPRADGLEILHARSRVVVDSAAAGIRRAVRHRPPGDRGRRRAGGSRPPSRARSASAGRSASTRSRCRSSTASFAPSEREVAWARRVVDEFEASGEGVLAVNGEMIDLPVVERARRILDEEGSERMSRRRPRSGGGGSTRTSRSATSSRAGSAAP